MASHLRPTAPIAADALLPGDPGRALALAQALLDRPRMANHSRGLWGYSGQTTSGKALTVQATGVGGPSVAVVLSELAERGVRRAIRLGTCTALDPGVRLGETLVVEGALAVEGASVALGADAMARPDPRLTAGLRDGGLRGGTVVSVDLYYDPEAEARRTEWSRVGAHAIEMGSATLFALGARLGVEVAAALVVATDGDESLDDDALERASARLGALSEAALAGAAAQPASGPD